jgi:uncharacterized protein
MKQVILVHGAPYEEEFYNPEKPSSSNTNWFPWFQKQVALADGLCQALEFPKPYDPVYEDWKAVFEQLQINTETILIGHSCGGGFLTRYLSEYSGKYPKKIILVAPWLDPEKELTTDFFDFEIDSELPEKTEVHIFSSSDDDTSLLKSFEIFKEKLPNAIWHEFSDKGHFCEKEFPELLGVIVI